jgi:hypothetical protein
MHMSLTNEILMLILINLFFINSNIWQKNWLNPLMAEALTLIFIIMFILGV